MIEHWKGTSAEQKYLMKPEEVNWSSFMVDPVSYLREAFLASTEEDPVADTPEGARILLGQIELMLDGAALHAIAVTQPDFAAYKTNGLLAVEGCAAYTRIAKAVGLSKNSVSEFLQFLYDDMQLEHRAELLVAVEAVYDNEA